MVHENSGDINNDAWYNMNFNPPQEEIKNRIENNFELMYFMFSVYRTAMIKLAPDLHKLMWQQYPVFSTEKRPFVIEAINEILYTTGSSLLCKLFYLVQGQKAGENVRIKHPQFNHWVEFYGRPHQPDTLDDTTRPQFNWLNDEEWKVYGDIENQALLASFSWEEKRKFEFINLMQTILFAYFKELEELNSDEWIIYAADINEEYETYQQKCGDIELFIDCGIPEEEIKLTEKEFRQDYHSLSQEIKDKTNDLRNRNIAVEMM